jgi:hypothetical protein
MKNLLFASLLLVYCPIFAQNEWSVDKIPAALLTDAKAVVRLDQNYITIKNTGEAMEESRYVVTFFTQPKDYELTIGGGEGGFYSTPTLIGRLYDKTGKLIYENEKSEIQKFGDFSYNSFSNVRTKLLKLQSQELPFTVEFLKKTKSDGFVSLSDNTILRFDRSVQKYEMTIVCPEDYKFKWKSVNIDLKPSTMTLDKKQIQYKWMTTNLTVQKHEPNHPYNGNNYAYLAFSQEQVQLGKYVGNASNWKEFGQFVYKLNNERDEISPEMQAKVLELTKGVTDKSKKIDLLYKFLQQNYRYVSIQIGVGGWQTLEASFVEKNKFGDCKALSNYMKALLKVVGIPSYLSLVYGGDDDLTEIDPAFVKMSHFNHMILFIPETGSWLECTSNNNPTGYMGNDWVGNRQALVLTPDGGILKQTPAYKEQENKKSSTFNLTINTDGTSNLTSKSVRLGGMEDYYRTLNTEYKGAELEKEFSKKSALTLTTLSNLSIKPNAEKPETIVTYEAIVRNFANKSGKRYFITPTKVNPLGLTLSKNEARKLPLLLKDAYTLEDSISINLPSNYKSESIPENKKLESATFGSYSIAYISTENTLKVYRKVVYPTVSVPASEYAKAQEFYAEIVKLDARQAVFTVDGGQ